MRGYTPSEASTRSGFSLDTLRYYEKIGLLAGISRTSGGQRIFTEDDLGWLGLLRCLRDTGMPLAQISRYAAMESMAERIRLLEEHAEEVEEKMRLLQAQYEHLRGKIDWHRGALLASAP